jgi:hypothetical protein
MVLVAAIGGYIEVETVAGGRGLGAGVRGGHGARGRARSVTPAAAEALRGGVSRSGGAGGRALQDAATARPSSTGGGESNVYGGMRNPRGILLK